MVACSPRPQVFEGQGKMESLHSRAGQVHHLRGQDCTLTLEGEAAQVVVFGHGNFVRLRGAVAQVRLEGRDNKVECALTPEVLVLRGQGQRVELPPRQDPQRPRLDVEGNNQAVVFRQSEH